MFACKPNEAGGEKKEWLLGQGAKNSELFWAANFILHTHFTSWLLPPLPPQVSGTRLPLLAASTTLYFNISFPLLSILSAPFRQPSAPSTWPSLLATVTSKEITLAGINDQTIQKVVLGIVTREFPLWLRRKESDWYPWGRGFDPWPCSVGCRSSVAMGCGMGRRCGLDLALLWLWCRPAAVAPLQPLTWEPPYVGAALKDKKKKERNYWRNYTKLYRMSDWTVQNVAKKEQEDSCLSFVSKPSTSRRVCSKWLTQPSLVKKVFGAYARF